MFFRSYVCFVRLKISLQADEIVPTSFVRKNLYVFNNKFFSITTICFVSFLYSVFNEHLFFLSFSPFSEKWRVKSEEVKFSFAFAYENFGRPKWTLTTFKNLSLQKRFRFFRVKHKASFSFKGILFPCSLVGPSGLEPPTSCLSGTRSNLLSYEPMWLVSKWSSSLGFFTSLFSFLVNSE